MNQSTSQELEQVKKHLEKVQAELEKVLVEKHFLEESTRHLNFLHNTHDGVFFTNSKDELVFINPYLLQMLEYEDPEALVGKPVPDEIWDDPSDKEQLLEDLRTQGFVRERVLTMRNAQDEPVFVSCSAVSVLDPSNEYVGAEVMLCNITSKQLLQRQRVQELESIRTRAESLYEKLDSDQIEDAKTEADSLINALDEFLG